MKLDMPSIYSQEEELEKAHGMAGRPKGGRAAKHGRPTMEGPGGHLVAPIFVHFPGGWSGCSAEHCWFTWWLENCRHGGDCKLELLACKLV